MQNKCDWCLKFSDDLSFQAVGGKCCSESCLNKYFYRDIALMILGVIFMLIFVWMPIIGLIIGFSHEGFDLLEHKIFFPHTIASFFIMLSAMFIYNDLTKYTNINFFRHTVMQNIFPLLILISYFIYSWMFYVKFIGFDDEGFESKKIFGLSFSTYFANIMLYLSLISLIYMNKKEQLTACKRQPKDFL